MIPTPPRVRILTVVTRRQLANAARAAERRDELIAQAIREGWRHQDVADIVGLSRGRVSQIAAAAKHKGEEA